MSEVFIYVHFISFPTPFRFFHRVKWPYIAILIAHITSEALINVGFVIKTRGQPSSYHMTSGSRDMKYCQFKSFFSQSKVK